MRQWKKSLLIFIAGAAYTAHSCTTMLATSARDAAIDGVSAYVEATTAELLDQWFGPNGEEQ